MGWVFFGGGVINYFLGLKNLTGVDFHGHYVNNIFFRGIDIWKIILEKILVGYFCCCPPIKVK